MISQERPCNRLQDCHARAKADTGEPAADPQDRGISTALTRLWEDADTAGRGQTADLDKAHDQYGEHIAQNPAEGLTGTPITGDIFLDDALARLREASQNRTREISLAVRSLALGAAALPRCAACPVVNIPGAQ